MQDKNPLAHYSGLLTEAVQESAGVPDQAQIKALMRKHRIWIEHSTLLEEDEPARELRAVQAEQHQFEAFVQDLIALSATKTTPESDYLEGVSIPNLREALIFLGRENGVGEGQVGDKLAQYVNSVVSGVLAKKATLREAAQAAPAAVAVHDERAIPAWETLNEWFLSLPEGRQAVLRDDKWMLANSAFEAGQARAALAATPAAVQTHAEAAAALGINSALIRIRAGNHAEAIAPLEHALRALEVAVERPCGICGADEAFTGSCGGGRANPRALCFEGAAAPAADVPTDYVRADKAYSVLQLHEDLQDVWSEANAVDTVIGRPDALMKKLTRIRDAVANAANGYLPIATVAAAPVALPEPVGAIAWNRDGERPTFHAGCRDKELLRSRLDGGLSMGPYRTEFAFTEPQVRALLAGVSAPAAQAVLDYPWRDRLLDGRELVRDQQGFAEHSELPLLDEGMKPRAFFAALGVEMKHTMADDDLSMDEYDAMSDAENWSAWIPRPPIGDAWNLVAIFDTEDGPAAWWARALKESREAAPQAQADARDAVRRDLDAQELQGIALQAAWRGGLKQNAPAYLPRSPVSAAVFKAHNWVIEAMRDAIKAAQAAQQGGDKQ